MYLCTILQIAASSQSAYNQFLKIQVAWYDFLKTILEMDSAYRGFKYWKILSLQPTDNAKMVKTDYWND